MLQRAKNYIEEKIFRFLLSLAFGLFCYWTVSTMFCSAPRNLPADGNIMVENNEYRPKPATPSPSTVSTKKPSASAQKDNAPLLIHYVGPVEIRAQKAVVQGAQVTIHFILLSSMKTDFILGSSADALILNEDGDSLKPYLKLGSGTGWVDNRVIVHPGIPVKMILEGSFDRPPKRIHTQFQSRQPQMKAIGFRNIPISKSSTKEVVNQSESAQSKATPGSE